MANDAVTKAVKKTAAPAKKTAAKKATRPRPAPPPLPPAGWYPDPTSPEIERYWDGDGWDTSRGSRQPGTEDDPAAAGGDDGGSAPTPTPAGTITFRGRVMLYHRPTPDQLAMWKRIAERAEASGRDFATPKPCPACEGKGCEACQGTGSAHTATILRLFDRAMNIITSLIADEADRDWLEDELIAGHFQLQDASEIIRLTVDAMIAGKPSAAPRNGPAPKARRRR